MKREILFHIEFEYMKYYIISSFTVWLFNFFIALSREIYIMDAVFRVKP